MTERRSRLIVDQKTQWRIILSVSLPTLLVIGAILGMSLVYERALASGTMSYDHRILGVSERWLTMILLLVGATLVNVLYALRMSHRVAGASYRLSKTLESFRDGERGIRAKLRDGDLHEGLADDLNSFLDWAAKELPAGAVGAASAASPRPRTSAPAAGELEASRR